VEVKNELFIGGRWVAPTTDATFDVVSPSTELVIATVPAGGPGDIDRAVMAARQAFDNGPWPRLPVGERAATMLRLASELQSRVDELATTITAEMGATITVTRLGHAPAPIALLEYYAKLADTFPFSEHRVGMTGPGTIVREPVGVVAAIVPWNAPFWLAMFKLAPALLAGCTIVLKPAPETPLDSYLLAEAIDAAGFPEGVVSIVTADRQAGQHLIEHPGVDKVAFTGSTAAGRTILEACARNVKNVTLELGGKSAAVFLDDVDLGVAIGQFLPGAIINNGEACAALTRVLAPRARHDEIVEALCAAFSSLPVGDPFDESTVMGPLVSDRIRQRVEGYIALGEEEGAKIAIGGGRPSHLDRGFYVEPTIFTNVDNSMRIAQEEIFGPVIAVIPYDSDDEAIGLANDTVYGLYGAVFTDDLQRGYDVARRIRAGTCAVNRFGLDMMFPFGGFKQSGLGREGGPEGLQPYLETKVLFGPEGDDAPAG